MLDDWLFAYGGDSIDNPTAAVLVPEGMSTQYFLFSIEDDSFGEFVGAVQEANNAASRGDVKQVDHHLDTVVRVNRDYASKGMALRGIEEYNKHTMSLAIENHLATGNSRTKYVNKCAMKYDIPLK